MAGPGVWDRTANETGWTALLGERRGGPDVSPYAAPPRAEDLSGLPPAFLDASSAETFRDEVVTYATPPVAGRRSRRAPRMARRLPLLTASSPRQPSPRPARRPR